MIYTILGYAEMYEEYKAELINQRDDAFDLIWNHNKEIGRNLPDEELRQGIEKFIDKGNAIAVLKEDRVIAFMVLYCNSYDTLKAYICNVYVLEQYRRKHCAEKMMKMAVEICMKNHFKAIDLHVAESNAPAVSLYKKLGFYFTDNYRNTDREMELRLTD